MDYQLGPGPLQVDQNTIDEKIKGDIGIVENGDVATHAISSGYYVIWKGDLYVAKTDISSGTTLSAASNGNLTAKPNGLGAEVAALNSKLTAYAGTSQQFILVKVGHVVQFQIQWDIPRAYADGEVIGSVPNGYAPERTSNCHVFGTDGAYLGMLRINTDKTIIPVFGQLKAGTARGMFVYVSAD